MARHALARAIERSWYRALPNPLLVPLSLLFQLVVGLRRAAYRRGWFVQHRVPSPVLIVGNISVGGSGKTPLVIALVERASALGLSVGVVSRGYGGQAAAYPLRLDRDTPAAQAGDEAVLIARRTGAPVVVDPDRVRAAKRLCQDVPQIGLIVSDDGLQHYRLARAAEIVVRDARRGDGNGWLLPAGPLREPRARAAEADLALTQGTIDDDYRLEISTAVSLVGEPDRPLVEFGGRCVHAVAAIGDPSRFFTALRRFGIAPIEHPFPDHHRFIVADLAFGDDHPVLMTEKDAVKCEAFARAGLWMVPAQAVFQPRIAEQLDQLLRDLAHSRFSDRKAIAS